MVFEKHTSETAALAMFSLVWKEKLIIGIALGDENMSSLKPSHYLTRSSLSSTLSGAGLSCAGLRGPVPSLVLSPLPRRASPACFLVVHVSLSFPQSLSLHQIWLAASL